MPAELTRRQQQILDFIQTSLKSRGLPPTRAEIAEAFGFRSATAAYEHLRLLAQKGALELLPGASRGIRLKRAPAPSADEFLSLPVVGRVAAGAPILSDPNFEERYQIDRRLFRPKPDFLLRVRGDSMIGAGILDGDLAAVRQTPQVENGQIAVLRLDDEITLKRYRRRGDTVLLHSENPAYAPIEVNLRRQALAVEGLYVGCIRAGGRRPSIRPASRDDSGRSGS
jgi:repressor LexA